VFLLWPCHFLIQKYNNSPPLEHGKVYVTITKSMQKLHCVTSEAQAEMPCSFCLVPLAHSHSSPESPQKKLCYPKVPVLWGGWATNQVMHQGFTGSKIFKSSRPRCETCKPALKFFQPPAWSPHHPPHPLSLCSPSSRLWTDKPLYWAVWTPDAQNPEHIKGF
jgi:hypothetical protein